jgi:trehalose 2-sulfotransferase
VLDLLRPVLGLPEIRDHETRWAERFASVTEPPPADRGIDWHTMLWVAMTPRSGSTWLTRLLIQTRALGRPWEHLAPDASLFERLPAQDWRGYLDAIGRGSATDNGVAGVKANLFQVVPLLSRGLLDDPSRRNVWVYLTREDLVAQAISLHRAFATGEWQPGAARTLEGPAGAAAPVYDAARITAYVSWLVRMMGAWERVFAALGAQPLRLTYEGLEADPRGTVAAIARHLGVEVNLDRLDPGAGDGPQRTDESAAWAIRYREETALAMARARRTGRPLRPGGIATRSRLAAIDTTRRVRRRIRSR